jgi:hypothetical protein
MAQYQIRILAFQDEPGAVMATFQPSDGEAIREAKKIADGRPVELWRGAVLVYPLASEAMGHTLH